MRLDGRQCGDEVWIINSTPPNSVKLKFYYIQWQFNYIYVEMSRITPKGVELISF